MMLKILNFLQLKLLLIIVKTIKLFYWMDISFSEIKENN